jgi:mannose-1-phosphate guanylyltransferase
VVLAGGEGRRLRPITFYFQKCMIPVGSSQKPLLEYIVHLLKMHGIIDIRMLVGYKHEQIENFFGEGGRFGISIDYFLDDPALSGSGGALLNAAKQSAFEGADALLVYYGDILSDIDLSEMLRQHFEAEASVTLAVTKGYEVPIGVAKIKDTTVVDWVEKPKIDLYAGIGVIVLSPESLETLKEIAIGRDAVDIMGDLVPHLIMKGKRAEAYVTEAFWYDLGSTEKYEKIDNGLVDDLFKI